ncbi:hypothetical protein P879_01249 [Paragonimus westermani]|uniref:Uncharacterized protein n=1 Tax=Paragonimus westermani TaxID=34504 RepID=A0A8T0DZD2_9TREM|nr:hypothetical protein P879_01249 [Paragonimus westermani]
MFVSRPVQFPRLTALFVSGFLSGKSIPASQWPLIGRARQTRIGATGFGQFSPFPTRRHTEVDWMLGSSKTELFRKPVEQINSENGPKQRGQNAKRITSTPTSANHAQVSPDGESKPPRNKECTNGNP